MPEVLQELQFSVCALGQDRGAERLHDLLDRHGLAGELVLRGTTPWSVCNHGGGGPQAYQTSPKAPMPTGCRSVYLYEGVSRAHAQVGHTTYLLVISNVVPKICARTNSAMMGDGSLEIAADGGGSGRVEWVGVAVVGGVLKPGRDGHRRRAGSRGRLARWSTPWNRVAGCQNKTAAR